MSETNINTEKLKEFVATAFQSEGIEQTVVTFIEKHFPLTCARDNRSEQIIIRFLSYILGFAGNAIHEVQVQVLMAGLYGMLNLYGVKATVAIMVKMAKKANATKKEVPSGN
jgi:hypothetical protein